MRGPRLTACAAVLAVAGAASGCGVRPTGTLSAGANPVVNGQAATVTVYLLRGKRLVPVVRPGLAGHPYLGILQLGVPITPDEEREGLHSEVPVQEGINVSPPVDVSPPAGVSPVGGDEIEVFADFLEIEAGLPKPGGTWTRAALAQVVCTGQAVPGVRRVKVYTAAGDRGTMWLTCDRFSDLLG